MMRGRVRMQVSGKLLAGVFASHSMREVVSDMPLDAEVIGVHTDYDVFPPRLCLIVESADFPVPAEGSTLMDWAPTTTFKWPTPPAPTAIESVLATLERPYVWLGDGEFPTETHHAYYVGRGGTLNEEKPICGGRVMGMQIVSNGGCPDCASKLTGWDMK